MNTSSENSINDKIEPDKYYSPEKFLTSLYRFKKGENQPDYSAQRRPTAQLRAIKDGEVTGNISVSKREDILQSGTISRAQKFIRNNKDANLYYGSTIHRTLPEIENPNKDNFHTLAAFIVDVDFYKADNPPEKPDAWILDRLNSYELSKPHYIIHTSELGRQVVWLTYQDTRKIKRERDKYRSHVNLLRDKFTNQVFHPHADQSNNPIQLFRIPGTYNRKPEKDGYKVKARELADTEIPYSFYGDLFSPLYEVSNKRSSETEHSSKGESKGVYINAGGSSGGNSGGAQHAVTKLYEALGPQPSASNDYKVTTGYILLKKGFGKSRGEIKAEIREWIDRHGAEISESQLNALIRWSFNGESNGGKVDGVGWSAKYARKYLELDLETLRDVYKLFDNPVVRVENATQNAYMDLSERREALRHYVVNLQVRGELNGTQRSYKQFASGAGIKESTFRRDLRTGKYPRLIADNSQGKTTEWTYIPLRELLETTLLKSIKAFKYISSVSQRFNTNTLMQCKGKPKNQNSLLNTKRSRAPPDI